MSNVNKSICRYISNFSNTGNYINMGNISNMGYLIMKCNISMWATSVAKLILVMKAISVIIAV